MSLTAKSLEGIFSHVANAASPDAVLEELREVIDVFQSRQALSEVGLRGTWSGSAARDYVGVFSVFQKFVDKEKNKWSREVGQAIRDAVLHVLPDQPPQAPSPPPVVQCSDSCEGDDISEFAPPEIISAPSPMEIVDAVDANGIEDEVCMSSAVAEQPSEEGLRPVEESFSSSERPIERPAEEGMCMSSDCMDQPPEETPRIQEESSSPIEPAVERAEDSDTDPCVWVAMLLAALLPLLSDALPRDHSGVCIIPHQHHMEKQEAPVCITGGGWHHFRTNKICDNCGQRIQDRIFFHCSESCDIDFCQECHRKSEEVMNVFLERAGDADRDAMSRRLFWVIDVTERLGYHVLHRNVMARSRLANELAFEWPTPMFECLIQAAIDVVNAKVVHVQDVKDIESDSRFWYAVSWLQFLYSVNSLPCNTRRLGEQGTRRPKVEYERFILEGINKCEPLSEFQRWREHPSAKVPDVLTVETFKLTADYCSFLTHSNLVPVCFRRVCLLCDVWEQIQNKARRQPLQLKVQREPNALLQEVLDTFQGLGDDELRRQLRVTFVDEEAEGPGVLKEFFQVALRSFLECGAADGEKQGLQLFRCNGHRRTYWFDEETDNAEAFRACGILLGQAVLNNVLVPNIFPRVLYDRLLKDLDSPCARKLGLEDLAMVSDEVAQSMRLVLDYTGEDIASVFGELGWSRTGLAPKDCALSQSNKHDYVQAYVDWFFGERVEKQFQPLSAGFRAILGSSSLLRNMVDAVQLEMIVCGGAVPVDAGAIQRGATLEGWTEEEQSQYLPQFWEILSNLTDTEKVQFIVFVTASDRVPLRGWQDLGLTVQKNGIGDDRLPTAYTCFCQLLLPMYSTKEKLRSNLLTAIANSEGFGLR